MEGLLIKLMAWCTKNEASFEFCRETNGGYYVNVDVFGEPDKCVCTKSWQSPEHALEAILELLN